MADEQQSSDNQTASPQQQAAPQPQQQVQPPQQPAPQQPPGPPPNAEAIIAAQQAQLQQQIASAQQRDRAQFGPAAVGAQSNAPVMGQRPGQFAQAAQPQPPVQQPAPAQGFNLPQGQSAQQVAQGAPQQPSTYIPPGLTGIPNPAIEQNGAMQMPDLSGLPDPSVPQNGVTVQQLAASAHQIQGGPPIQYGAQPQAQQVATDKPTVNWFPGRNSQLTIELADSYISRMPDSIEKEPDPQAKVVAALLSEILSLRARLDQLEQGASPNGDLEPRVYRLEMTLFEQTQSLNQGAQALREEAIRQATLENHQQGATQTGTPPQAAAQASQGTPQQEPPPDPQPEG